MYIVVSRWAVMPEHSSAAEEGGRKVRDVLRAQPGVLDVRGFRNEDGVFVAVISYADEAAYRRVIDDPQGAFARALEDSGLTRHAVWIGSERGESQD
jgi:quinol monooxygenase YgiN